ncbi:MAG: hypothetical protein PHR24_02410 [Oscillospiraceae bacterium]|nr:hypothetical protein [Oscillospiraceae bacterium]
MLFCEKPQEREYERLMTSVPNFRRPSCGLFICEDTSLFITCPYFELVSQTVRYMKNRSFNERFRNYIKERIDKQMIFKNQQHEAIFKNESRKPRNQSARMLTALYLFTADHSLWARAKHCISQEAAMFDKVSLASISLPGYTLYNAALTLCCNKDKLSVSELADKNTVSPMLFELICEAMTIRRYGMAALTISEHEVSKIRKNSIYHTNISR